MKNLSPPSVAGVQRALTALALSAAASATMAAPLPPFTFDPGAVGLDGDVVTADNIVISDYSTITFGADDAFSDSGFLSFSNYQLSNTFVNDTGLNDGYGLYIAFEGAGTLSPGGDPTVAPTVGNFDSLTYTMYGYNGAPATFGFDGSNTPTITGAAGAIVLGTGTLVNGSVSTVPTTAPGGAASFIPSANATTTFEVASGMEGFFADPQPFYNLALSAFTNTVSQVEAFDGGFRIRQGGGAINFAGVAAPIPEPGTYALMLAGLAVVGTVVRRRRKS